MTTILVYIPAYNEEDTIAEVVENIRAVRVEGCTVDIVVVDDGSTDATAAIAEKSGATVESHRNNKGVGSAFATAIHLALEGQYDMLVSIDADNQFLPTEIPLLLEPLIQKNADVALGSRFEHGRPRNMPLINFWGNKLMCRVLSFFLHRKVLDATCGFRAYTRDALMQMCLVETFTYTQETLMQLEHKRIGIRYVPITAHYYPERNSRVVRSIRQYALSCFLIIIRFMRDYRPLFLIGGLGGIIFFLGCLCDAFLLGHYVVVGGFSPYKFVGVLGLSLNGIGMLLMALSFIADSFARTRLLLEQVLYLERKKQYSPPQ